MKDFIEFIKRLFAPAETTDADETCPHCRGLGYDASGFWCRCDEREKV